MTQRKENRQAQDKDKPGGEYDRQVQYANDFMEVLCWITERKRQQEPER
jgi:hypothetical protein